MKLSTTIGQEAAGTRDEPGQGRRGAVSRNVRNRLCYVYLVTIDPKINKLTKTNVLP